MKVCVSVIAAVHNGGDKLRKSLESLKNQSLREFQVIMVDAASDDNTAEIMKSFTSDKRFTFISFEDKSISEGRNLALDKAEGEYIAFMSSSVVFTKNFLSNMYKVAADKGADLCVSPMESSDIYGKHEFSSASVLSKHGLADKFDMNLIWNPAVTNKLFRKERLTATSTRFRPYGKAREAAFSIPFAFKSNLIACASGCSAIYINPVKNEGVSEFPIEQYLGAYEYIINQAEQAFDSSIEKAQSDYDRKELKKQKICYIDEIYHKEITVLLYSYYRHFWSLEEKAIESYGEIINSLTQKLSKTGRAALIKKNKDIFYTGSLITDKKEMAQKPAVTLCISGHSQLHPFDRESLSLLVASIFNQTMPGFELLVDSSLSPIFPEAYSAYENITFVNCEGRGEFKDICLDRSRTDYIMYLDLPAILNPKILMRHYCLLEGKDKFGFTTSPLTCFDGSNTHMYTFSELFFKSYKGRERISEQDKTYLLDLFFCNKLFSVAHLRGIHFSFSDNAVYDVYKLYKHSRFKKLFHRGAYFSLGQDELISYLRKEEKLFDVSKRKILKNYRFSYFRAVKLKNAKERVAHILSRTTGRLLEAVSWVFAFLVSKIPLRERVFFFTSRTTGEPDENLNHLYKSCRARKLLMAKERPYSLRDNIKFRYYLITSKVIVTDDYIHYLRLYKLRKEQRLIQLWYTGGAFKKMGIDSSSSLSYYDEYKTHSQYSTFCVSSEYVRQHYCHAFGLDYDVVKALGTPRSDLVADKELIEKNRQEICSKHPLLKNKKVYIYCPTVRIKEDSYIPFNPEIDWSRLNDDLADDEVFIICRHPSMKEEYLRGSFYSRVKDYTFESTSELLAVADVIITDYSSIVFDASLMDKPMVFYCPDYEQYSGDFYLDYNRELPGEIITDSVNLLPASRRAKENSSPEIIADFREKQMGACDGNSTQRILSLIDEYLK